mmetsp:Transcript_21424/g.49084  ORF Transcript_21424/g.49084 Transcript_21424/m.49084 type:complete len:166 (+) Transcript_21424:33-530(+)
MAEGALEIRLSQAGGYLSDEQKKKIADNFRLLDRDRDGRLTPQEVGTLFRAFGQNPTDEELRELLKTVPAGGLDRPGFEAFFSGNYRNPTSTEALVKAFQVFDMEDSGMISAQSFKEMITSMGEPMPEEQVDAILREAGVNEKGMMDYKALAQRLVAGPRRIPGM